MLFFLLLLVLLEVALHGLVIREISVNVNKKSAENVCQNNILLNIFEKLLVYKL